MHRAFQALGSRALRAANGWSSRTVAVGSSSAPGARGKGSSAERELLDRGLAEIDRLPVERQLVGRLRIVVVAECGLGHENDGEGLDDAGLERLERDHAILRQTALQQAVGVDPVGRGRAPQDPAAAKRGDRRDAETPRDGEALGGVRLDHDVVAAAPPSRSAAKGRLISGTAEEVGIGSSGMGRDMGGHPD